MPSHVHPDWRQSSGLLTRPLRLPDNGKVSSPKKLLHGQLRIQNYPDSAPEAKSYSFIAFWITWLERIL